MKILERNEIKGIRSFIEGVEEGPCTIELTECNRNENIKHNFFEPFDGIEGL